MTKDLFTEVEIQSILNYGIDRKKKEDDVIRNTYTDKEKKAAENKKTAPSKLRPHSLAMYQEDIVSDEKDPEGLFFSKTMVLGALVFYALVVAVILYIAILAINAIKSGAISNTSSMSGLSWISGGLSVIVTTSAGVALSAVISYMNKTKLPSVINNEAKAHKYALENRLDYNFQMMEKQHELKMTDQEVAKIEASGEAKQIADGMFTDMNTVIKTAKTSASADLKKETVS